MGAVRPSTGPFFRISRSNDVRPITERNARRSLPTHLAAQQNAHRASTNICGQSHAALAHGASKWFYLIEALHEERAWNGVALSWQVAVLKILAASENGEAPVASITRDLSILVSARDGWSDRLRRSIPSNRPRDIFSDGLVTRPSRGHWRISPAGRDYLQSIENPFEFEEAAE